MFVSVLLVLRGSHAWACDWVSDPTTISCQLEHASAVPGATGVLLHATVTNTGTSDCTSTVVFQQGTEAPDVTITNTAPAPALVTANGGTQTFDIEVSIAATTDARTEETIGYKLDILDSPDFYCTVSQLVCIVPSGETSFSTGSPPVASGWPAQPFDGWDGSLLQRLTMHLWGMEFVPATADFAGRTIREVNGNAPFDGCWWTVGPDPVYNPVMQAQIDESEWTVPTPNTGIGSWWRFDRIGWNNNYVNWYRGTYAAPWNVDVTPCSAVMNQVMEMKCHALPAFEYWVPYQTNDLIWGNNELCPNSTNSAPSVVSGRGASCKDKPWP